MKGNNLVILRGHLGGAPEEHRFDNGDLRVRLRLATNNVWTSKEGEKRERTDWHNVDVHGRPAEFCRRYLQRGDHVMVLGQIRNDVVEDKQGGRRYYSSVRAQEVTALGGRGAPRVDRQDAPASSPTTPATGYSPPTGLAAADLPF